MRNDKSKVETVSRLWPRVLMLLILFMAFPATSVIAAVDPEEQALLPLVEQMESRYSQVEDYRAIFCKQERVDGKLSPEETILLKFQKPLKIYMKWIGEPLNGTEALYVQGKYENNLIAHSGGILGMITVSLAPCSPTAMKGHHPITESGFGFIIEQIRRNLGRALQYGEFQVIRMSEEYFNGRPTTVVESRFTPREGRKYYASRAVIHVDKELMLPVSSRFYDEKDRLFEKYSYTDVKLNIGLTDVDFSPQNEKYRF